jgi:glycosyltransferase involved in cell wall biosynthesis
VKILQVIGSVDPKGGGTTDHVYSTSQVWLRQGHECHILCLDPSDATCVARSPLITFALGSGGRLHTLWNYTSYGSWRALGKSHVPYFVCPHGMLDPWLREAYPTGHFLRTIFWKFFEWKVFRDTRGVFFACEEERELANESFIHDMCPEYVVGYGTQDVSGDQNTQKCAFLSKFPQLRGRKSILFLSRIHPKKGLDLLIKAFAKLADTFDEYDLVIAGPDDVGLKPQLMKIAAELGIQMRIHWTGMLTGDEKWGAFRSAEFFVLPSHQENFGIAVVEAMALSVPVLITKKVNIWREVQLSGGGRAVTDDIDGIAEGLDYMCSLTESQRQNMAVNARSCFLQRFNLEKNATELQNLMLSLCKP